MSEKYKEIIEALERDTAEKKNKEVTKANAATIDLIRPAQGVDRVGFAGAGDGFLVAAGKPAVNDRHLDPLPGVLGF
ncbi:MAG: hypothetical protein FGM55_06070 [Rhodoferax sp.]|nr:hypothetical protein [Rhodoferax sp.]